MSPDSGFGSPDPALSFGDPPAIPTSPPGPLRPLEFVIEIVGPHSLPSVAADALLTREWQGVLGAPRVWVMAPSDTGWVPLAAGRGGSYDSLALSYAMLDPRGTLTAGSSEALVKLAESFANQIGRRAMPQPVPADVETIVHALSEVREALDVGYGVAVAFANRPTEEELWKVFVAHGLTLSPQGEFAWGTSDALSVTPTDQPEQFTLKGVQAGRVISAVSIGFSVPRSPAPELSLKATLKLAEYLRVQFGGMLIDEDGSPVMPNAVQLTSYVGEAKASLEQAGIRPGSQEALALFGG